MARAVRGNFDQSAFGLALPTQPSPMIAPGAAVDPIGGTLSSQPSPTVDHGAVAEPTDAFPATFLGASQAAETAPEIWRSQVESHQGPEQAEEVDEAAEGEDVQALSFADFTPEKEFDEAGLGAGGAMLLKSPGAEHRFFDRHLIRQLLLSGKGSTTITKLQDNYGLNVSCGDGTKKRKKVRPVKADVAAVVKAAFEQFPRLGTYTPGGGDREVVLKAWSNSIEGQKLFHNELMRCCRLSLSQVSQRRAAFHDARPATGLMEDDAMRNAEVQAVEPHAAHRHEPPGTPLGRLRP